MARPPILAITARKVARADRSTRTGRPSTASPVPFVRTPAMLDLAFLVGGLAFFALAVGYAGLCARL